MSDSSDQLWPKLGAQTFKTVGEIYLQRAMLLIASGHVEEVFAPVPKPAGHAAELLKRFGG